MNGCNKLKEKKTSFAGKPTFVLGEPSVPSGQREMFALSELSFAGKPMLAGKSGFAGRLISVNKLVLVGEPKFTLDEHSLAGEPTFAQGEPYLAVVI